MPNLTSRPSCWSTVHSTPTTYKYVHVFEHVPCGVRLLPSPRSIDAQKGAMHRHCSFDWSFPRISLTRILCPFLANCTCWKQKGAAYDYLRRRDEQSQRDAQQLVDTHTRRLREHVAAHGTPTADQHNAESIRRQLFAAETLLERLFAETPEAKAERYAELYQAMIDTHDLGLADLDFGRTGL